MRSLCLLPWVILLTGCRPPAIEPEISRAEYGVFHDLLQARGEALDREEALVVSPNTLDLSQANYQYENCLPAHLRRAFIKAPRARLSLNVPVDWLVVSPRRPSSLGDTQPSAPVMPPAVYVGFSRVSFNRLRSEAFLWVDQTVCGATAEGEVPACKGEGNLLHATRHSGRWSFEETECRTLAFGA